MLVIDCEDIVLGTARLPDSPGVYAFYRRLTVKSGSSAVFSGSIKRLTSGANRRPAFLSTHISSRAYVEVYPGRRRIGKRQPVVDAIKVDGRKRRALTKQSIELSTFQQPLIVGESKNLRKRIHQHSKGSRPIRGLRRLNLNFRELVVAMIPVDPVIADTRAEYLMELLAATASIPTETLRV